MGHDRWRRVHAQDERVSKYEEGAREDEYDVRFKGKGVWRVRLEWRECGVRGGGRAHDSN
jgi:hypothetical protein